MSEENNLPPRNTPDWLLLELARRPDACHALLDAIGRDTGFEPKDIDVAQLSAQIDWKERPLKQLLSLLGNIYKFVHQSADDNQLSDEQIRVELSEVISAFPYLENVEDLPEKVIEALVPLMRFNSAAELKRKEEVIRKGALPNATGFSSVVELLPVFSIDRKSIIKYVTAIQFRVTTDRKGSEDIIFQIDAEDISSIREVLDVLEDKIRALRPTLDNGGQLPPAKDQSR